MNERGLGGPDEMEAEAFAVRAAGPHLAAQPHLVIAAGGTGGHMFPAQALAQEMLRRGWRVTLSTDDRGLRFAGGFPEEVERREVHSATFARGGMVDKLRAPFTILKGVSDATQWFRTERPSVVAGFGGYPSLPALTAAWRLNVPRLIHEQNGVLGRVNTVFAGRVNAIAAGVLPIVNAPKKCSLVDIGNPIRDAVRAVAGAPYEPPSAGGPVHLLIFGGSQGAAVFARLAPRALVDLPLLLRARLKIVQQVRPEDLREVRAVYDEAGMEAELSPFFDDMPERMQAAHLVLSRAGASTVAELSAVGRPAILAPYPAAAADHQTVNARALAEAEAAIMYPDAEMTSEGLTRMIEDLIRHPRRLATMARASAKRGRPAAAEALADLVERIAKSDAGGR